MSNQLEQVKEQIEETFNIDEKLKLFQRLLTVIRGQQDIKNRISLILNPEKPETSTKLTDNQIDFVSLSLQAGKWYDEFTPLSDYALEFCLVNLSKDAIGLNSAIQLNQAFNERGLLSKFGVNLSPQSEQTGNAK